MTATAHTPERDPVAMKVGVILPDTSDWPLLRDLARSAERVGADSVWVADGFANGHVEAWTTVSALAASTEHVEVGVYMLNASLRDLPLLARMAACLGHVAPGRVRIMLGTGWDRADYEALGRDFPSPASRTTRTRDAVSVLKQQTQASVEVAGVTDDVLGIVAAEADGWGLSADALDVFFERATFLRRACDASGRSFDDLRISCTLPCVEDASSRMADLHAHGMNEFRVGLGDGGLERHELQRLVEDVKPALRR